ncbi:phage capsid protein [Candidatus Liberibacter solanacearum]|uniref:Uncharacterized protein n=1 Tax=Candidatus Liberibacter solanacearum TaxID=556287 RepID=A0A1V2N6U6_9HYPH|nr:phage capsid protein [Candidatus Liberibacter solanacearum]ONI58420.1 hypothetical protein AYO25_05125 [Candidatus Liberibacter solanacearum]ONI59039.1 hypothetical protein AYJ09_01230 [Candidatus Liberibacter solanacearum]
MIVPLEFGEAPVGTGLNKQNLTFDKVNEAAALLESNGAKDINVIMFARDHVMLRSDPRLTSRDYIYTGKLEDGVVARVLGMNIYHSEAIPGGSKQEKKEVKSAAGE